MASDVMRVRLHLRQIRVVEVLVDTPAVLRVRVESSQTNLRCPHCGFKCHKVHDTRERQVRDLEVSGRWTTLVWMRRRFSCGNCTERFLEDHDSFDGKLTRRMAHRLVAGCASHVDPCGGAPPRCALDGDHDAGAGLVTVDRRTAPQSTLQGVAGR